MKMVEKSPTAGGRPPLFCSDSCRANYHNIAQQLRRSAESLTAQISDAAVSESERREAVDKLVDVRWHLARFAFENMK